MRTPIPTAGGSAEATIGAHAAIDSSDAERYRHASDAPEVYLDRRSRGVVAVIGTATLVERGFRATRCLS